MYWIVSVPFEDARVKTFKRIKKDLTDAKLCECFDFPIPKLRVGTLDQLMSLADELGKQDSAVEAAAVKLYRQLLELREGTNEEFEVEVFMPGDNSAPVGLYLSYFQWDENQYMVNKSLKEISEAIYKKAMRYDDELKVKSAEYSTLKTNMNQIERKKTGPLTVRSLDGLVEQQHVVDTEYLATLFVVVPKGQQSEWNKTYDSLDNIEMIVPGSSAVIADDNEFSLNSVVLIRKVMDDFKSACAKRKWVVRDFEFDEQRFRLSSMEQAQMQEKKEALRRELLEWCKVTFSETFSAWIHLKAIRTFVESVLRYGLPARFASILLKVTKNEAKVHRYFRDNFKHLNDADANAAGADHEGIVGGYGETYYPYVLLTLSNFFTKQQ